MTSRKKSFITFILISAFFIIISIFLGEVNRFLPQAPVARAVVTAVVFLGTLNVSALFLVWWERKIAGHIQRRLGPMHVGWHGILQTIADGIKLILKEDVIPENSMKLLFKTAPLIVFMPAFLAFVPVYIAKDFTGFDYDVAVLYILGVSGLSVIGIISGAYASNNKYQLLGGVRAVAQLVSYEIPRALSVLPVIIYTSTLKIHDIVENAGWFIFYPIVGQISFLIYLISTVAETNRVPFDIPEAESELVAGFTTEYSGIRFALLFLAEYGYVFLGSLLGVYLFFGGWNAPFNIKILPSWFWLGIKTLLFMFLFLWFRWTFPRFRVDRLMDFCWKFLIPAGILNIVIFTVLM